MEIITRSRNTGEILEICRYPEGRRLSRRIVKDILEGMMYFAITGEQNVYCAGALNAAVETVADGSTIYGYYFINDQLIRSTILAQ